MKVSNLSTPVAQCHNQDLKSSRAPLQTIFRQAPPKCSTIGKPKQQVTSFKQQMISYNAHGWKMTAHSQTDEAASGASVGSVSCSRVPTKQSCLSPAVTSSLQHRLKTYEVITAMSRNKQFIHLGHLRIYTLYP